MKKNTTSQSTLQTIKKKLQGKCIECGGTLPNHIGMCTVWGQEVFRKFDDVDNRVRHISTIIDGIIENNTIGFEQDV